MKILGVAYSPTSFDYTNSLTGRGMGDEHVVSMNPTTGGSQLELGSRVVGGAGSWSNPTLGLEHS